MPAVEAEPVYYTRKLSFSMYSSQLGVPEGNVIDI